MVGIYFITCARSSIQYNCGYALAVAYKAMVELRQRKKVCCPETYCYKEKGYFCKLPIVMNETVISLVGWLIWLQSINYVETCKVESDYRARLIEIVSVIKFARALTAKTVVHLSLLEEILQR